MCYICTLELNNVIQKKSTAGGPALKLAAPDDSSPSHSQASKEHDIIKDIEQWHYCEVCNAACIVFGKGGGHYVYSMTDKYIWAKLVVWNLSYYFS